MTEERHLRYLCEEWIRTAKVIAIDIEWVHHPGMTDRAHLIAVCVPESKPYLIRVGQMNLTFPTRRALCILIEDAHITKVFCDGRIDLVLLHRICGCYPRSIWDAQAAAELLDMGFMLSLERII